MAIARLGIPVKIRLNQSLAPARLLSIYARRGFVVNDFAISWRMLRADGVDSYGDGLFDSAQLHPSTFVDLFVSNATQDRLEMDGARQLFMIPIPPGHMLCLALSWSGVNGGGAGGSARVLWTFDELQSGRAPRLAVGDESAAVDRFTAGGNWRISADILAIRRRVRLIGRADVRERRRRVVVRNSMQNSDIRESFVSSLSVSGFRGFREPGLLELAVPVSGVIGSGLTVVVGANNAGKSSLWEGFEAVARKRNNGDVSFSEGRRNRGAPGGVRIALQLKGGASYVLNTIDPDTSETSAEWIPEAPTTADALKIVVLPSRRYFRASFNKGGDSRPDWMNNGGMGFSRYQERDQFTGRLFALHGDKTKKAKFDDLLEKIVGYRLEWKIDLADGQNGSSYFLKVTTAEGVDHSSDGLGDGIISLLFILDALYDPEPSTLLVIDEPELSLHPQLIRRLGREIARVAADRQIVIFTHSPLLVSWDDIEAGAEIARVYKIGGDSRIAQPSRPIIDEVSKVRGGWKNPHVLGSDANEALFLDDEIIVVEGQEDAGLLPIVFQSVGVARRGTIFGWGSGGGDENPRRLLGLLSGLGFQKVVALLDNDKPGEVEAIATEFPGYLATTIPAADIRDKPAHNFEGKAGLLDKRGKSLNPELKDATFEILTSVLDYFAGATRDTGSAESQVGPVASEVPDKP